MMSERHSRWATRSNVVGKEASTGQGGGGQRKRPMIVNSAVHDSTGKRPPGDMLVLQNGDSSGSRSCKYCGKSLKGPSAVPFRHRAHSDNIDSIKRRTSQSRHSKCLEDLRTRTQLSPGPPGNYWPQTKFLGNFKLTRVFLQ